MATLNFGATAAGSYTFNHAPAGDVLSFGATFHASKVVLANSGANLSVTYGAKTIVLKLMGIADITADPGGNFHFGDGSAIVVGGMGNDSLAGTAFGDQMQGLGGNDTLVGGLGADLIIGGGGADKLDGGIENDTLIGGAGNDAYTVRDMGNLVLEDSLNGGSGVDTVTALVTNYTLGDGVENLTLGDGVKKGTGNDLDNVVTGSGDSNSLIGGPGDDQLLGKLGADTLDGGLGDDTLNGAGGNDTYIVDSAGDSIVPDPNGTDLVKIAAGAGFDYTLAGGLEKLDASMVLGGHPHAYSGNGGDNVISSGNSADTLDGGAGNDSLRGGAGADSLIGFDGNDTLASGAGPDTLDGGYGDDTYLIENTGDVIQYAPNNALVDPQGYDTVSITGASIATFTFGIGIDVLDAISSTHGGLTIFGNAGVNVVFASPDADTIDGGAGGDYLYGESGDDSITTSHPGQYFSDYLDGGGGNDTLSGGYGADVYVIDTLGDQITGEVNDGYSDMVSIIGALVGTYTLGANLESVDASHSELDGSLTLFGNGAANWMRGGGYGDHLYGYTSGAILADIANDTLDGGAGVDTMDGGYGDDVYYVDLSSSSFLNPQDSITDSQGWNTIHLVGSGAAYWQVSGIDRAVYGDSAGVNYELHGGGGVETLVGNLGNDVIVGTNSIFDGHFYDGGGGNDAVTGSTAVDTILGGSGDDTINGLGGHDSIDAGFGNDLIIADLTPGGSFHIAGGDGTDTLELVGGHDADFGTISASISGIDKIDLLDDTTANQITIGYGDVIAMSDTDTLVVDGSSSDVLEAGSGAGLWSFVGFDGVYDEYTLNGATLFVDHDIVQNLAPL